MPMSATDIERFIKAKFPDATIQLTDLAGDNDHWAAHVVSAAFAGKLPLARHRLVYAALGAMMQTDIHALVIRARTPDEAA